MHSSIPPNVYVALKLPSDVTKVVKTVPNSNVSLGKYGSFPCNQIIGRPFYATFEIADHPDADGHVLHIVSAAELHTEALIADGEGDGDVETDANTPTIPFPQEDNRHIIDQRSTQQLTMAQIEELKQSSTHAGREIISKLLESHSALDQKTQFSRAKYMLRKRKKYLHRFTVVPMDVGILTEWMLEQKDPGRIIELRDEMIGLIGAWANVHYGGTGEVGGAKADEMVNRENGRWLIVDDTGGLVVAAMAERAGILYPPEVLSGEGLPNTTKQGARLIQPTEDETPAAEAASASHTTLTVIHPNLQPNLSMLKYFSHDINEPSETHPLSTHLKTLSWLQLLHPSEDAIYDMEPPEIGEEELASWKPSKRAMHFKKKRRWTRVRNVVDETRAGGFDGLIVATLMDPTSILRHTVPLLAGSAQVVVYSPYIEPLVQLADLYSTARRTAYITYKREVAEGAAEDKEEEFPVDPTLLLAPTLHTSRVRTWQVLPGRTHPLMTGRGGAEGYVFHAVRVLPAMGKVEARGVQAKKRRKMADETESS
ncbi:tRNA (adenine(58)-N(1))-methyltransferase non-catalytic subunit trm6 [Microsporum audouinii]